MKKIITTLFILSGIYTASFAQTKNTVEFGANIGWNLANISYADNNGDTYYNQIHQNREHDAVQEWFKARDVRGNTVWLERGLVDPFSHRPVFGPNPPGSPGNSVPLNEGTIFLLIAGVLLGVKILYDRRKNVETA